MSIIIFENDLEFDIAMKEHHLVLANLAVVMMSPDQFRVVKDRNGPSGVVMNLDNLRNRIDERITRVIELQKKPYNQNQEDGTE